MANRLRGAAVYLAGPMTACKDLGRGWREYLTPALEARGIVVLDPTRKPIDVGDEREGVRRRMRELQEAGRLEEVRKWMKTIRRVDLRMVDLSSFLIVRLDGSQTWGTTEELVVAIHQQKPVLVWLDGELTLRNVNPWLLSQFPLDHLFESAADLLAYVASIDESETHPNDRRWQLFHFEKLYAGIWQ